LNEAILDYRIMRRRNLRQTSERSIKRYAIFGTNSIGRVLEEVAVSILLFWKKKKWKKIVFILMKQICHFIQLLQLLHSIEIYGFKKQFVFEFINSNGWALKGFNWIELNNWPSNIKYWWCLSHFCFVHWAFNVLWIQQIHCLWVH
jgi:hypothetical protein